MNDRLVSVIIPVYNSEKYLDQCLHSVVKQTYKNIEIIIVNDGSTDNSEDICLAYAVKDTRIHYITQKNDGVSCARNTGLEKSHGQFVLFVDADDYIARDMIETLINMSSDRSMSVCNYAAFIKDGSITQKFAQYDQSVYDSRKDYLSHIHQSWGPVARLYARNIIGNIRFNTKYKMAEDLLFNIEIICNNPSFSIYASDKTLYYYRQDKESLSHQEFKDDREFTGIEAETEAYQLLLKNHMEDQNTRILFNGILLYYSRYASLSEDKKKEHGDEISYIRQLISTHRKYLLNARDKTVSERLKMRLIIYWPSMFIHLHEFVKRK